ncbi:hypothetical protein D3C87_1901270 [compost metagenome]
MGNPATIAQRPALPPITCDVCSKPVDRIAAEGCDHSATITIRVWCHGATDTMRLTQRFLAKIGREGRDQLMSSGGVAFQTQAIPAPVAEIDHA